MAKLTVVVVSLLLLCAVGLGLPATAFAQTPAWYHNGALIYQAPPGDEYDGLKIVWENSYVYEHPGSDPLYWYAHVVYRNVGSKTLTIWCTGVDDPSRAKEHMRGTPNSGYVPAEETWCSRSPTLTISLEPGDSYNTWAIFHNVPWPGGEVSLEWGKFGLSPWVDPWPSPPFYGRPPTVCPPELEQLGTCRPEIQYTGISPEQLQTLENTTLCATSILTHLGVHLPIVGPVIAAVTYGNEIIAVIQDPGNPNKYLQLAVKAVPGLSCLKLVAGSRANTPVLLFPPAPVM